jgi:signal transduction histidine kinase
VPWLVDQVRACGLEIRLSIEPPLRPIEPGLSLVAYRIVQEGLTNVMKHAGAVHAEVSVRGSTDELRIDVLDDGRSTGTPGSGHGMTGMRERAGAYGGTVTLRPRPGGGHVLSARIPT